MSSAGNVRRRKAPKNSTPDPSIEPSSPSSTAHFHSIDHDDKPASTSAPKSGFLPHASLSPSQEEYAWFVLFLSAFAYFLLTRGGYLISSESLTSSETSILSAWHTRGGLLSSLSKPYEVVSSSLWLARDGDEMGEQILQSIFYVSKSKNSASSSPRQLNLAPNHRLEIILSSPPDIFSENLEDLDFSAATSGGEECHTQSLQTKKEPSFFSYITSTVWVHDEELGRGYLLLADAGRSGRIWRWEVGGGPITIGRSLHMERSGCRSGLWVGNLGDEHGEIATPKAGETCPRNLFGVSSTYNNAGKMQAGLTSSSCTETATQPKISQHLPPLLGSASLAVELTRNAERSSCGKNLIVAEWGERRIVRVEGESGARTPLVTLVPNHRSINVKNGKLRWRRVHRPSHLMYTPFGDLLFSDNFEKISQENNTRTVEHIGVLYRRKEAVHIPPIPAEKSRQAHEWLGTSEGSDEERKGQIDVLFETSGWIEGVALADSDFSVCYVLVTNLDGSDEWSKSIYKISLTADDDDEHDVDDDEDDKNEQGGSLKQTSSQIPTLFYNMSSGECSDQNIIHQNNIEHSLFGSKLVVDEKENVYAITCPTTVSIVSKKNGQVFGRFGSDQTQPVAPTIEIVNEPSSYTSIGFGEDGYMYITSANEVMRIKSRVKGLPMPTNMVVPPPLKSKG
mmetsp:Transcript_10245/g.20463  ORF Transcript_10245/g.20463 Transcript_10245/m.20463 type:complete len:680 (+) Transcript_10245:233-2272(+)